MSIYKCEDIWGWATKNDGILCTDCYHKGDVRVPSRDKPLTNDDFGDDVVITCDDCGDVIY